MKQLFALRRQAEAARQLRTEAGPIAAAAGTFSAAMVGPLGKNRWQEDMLDVNRQTAENTEHIWRETRRRGIPVI